LIGSGLLAVPVLTGASAYAMCEALKWKSGLDEKFRGARKFYLVIAVSTLIGVLINFLKIPPVTALVWAAVINGVLAPPLIVTREQIDFTVAALGRALRAVAQ
jgi:Mn2+/Fe2+ NRAMP family transporter